MKKKNSFNIILKTLVAIVLVVFFLCLYWNTGSGTWGDDSDGYFLGAFNIKTKNEYVNRINKLIEGLKNKGYTKEELSFLVPNRFSIDSNGKLKFRYPLGTSLMIWAYTEIIPPNFPINSLNIFLAIISLVFFFLVLLELLDSYGKIEIILSGTVTFLFGTVPLYLKYVKAQPMREIPTIFFNTLILFFLLKFYKNKKILFLLISLFLASLSVFVRETNIFIFAFFLPYIYGLIKYLIKGKNKKRAIGLLSFITLTSIFLLLLLIFFPNTTLALKILPPNIDHFKTINPINMINNQGRYRPGEGSLFLFSKQILKFTPILPALFGIIFLIKKKKTWLLIYPLCYFLLFSMWVNPYDRYILPVYPFVFLIIFLGARELIVTMKKSKSITFLIFASLLLLNAESCVLIKENFLQDKVYYKSLNAKEFQILKSLNAYEGLFFIGESLYDQQGILSYTNQQSSFYKIPENLSLLKNNFTSASKYILCNSLECEHITKGNKPIMTLEIMSERINLWNYGLL